MDRLTPWQRCPRGQGSGVGQAVLITERDDPLIVHHQEIENRPLKVNIPRASAQIVQPRPGCIQKNRQQLIIRRKPGKRLQGKDLSGFLLHLFMFLRFRPRILVAI